MRITLLWAWLPLPLPLLNQRATAAGPLVGVLLCSGDDAVVEGVQGEEEGLGNEVWVARGQGLRLDLVADRLHVGGGDAQPRLLADVDLAARVRQVQRIDLLKLRVGQLGEGSTQLFGQKIECEQRMGDETIIATSIAPPPPPGS